MGLKDADGSAAELVALGAAVRRLRERHGWVPQNAVCFDAGLGDGYLSDLELGRSNPTFMNLVAIVRTLGFTLGDLVAAYEHKLAGIDPQAGHDAPVCPTPAALAHLLDINAEWAELQARALRRKLLRRRVG
jgi:transcriptional regulator with XRE-family HTH domain